MVGALRHVETNNQHRRIVSIAISFVPQILELAKQGHVGLRCEDELGDLGPVPLKPEGFVGSKVPDLARRIQTGISSCSRFQASGFPRFPKENLCCSGLAWSNLWLNSPREKPTLGTTCNVWSWICRLSWSQDRLLKFWVENPPRIMNASSSTIRAAPRLCHCATMSAICGFVDSRLDFQKLNRSNHWAIV